MFRANPNLAAELATSDEYRQALAQAAEPARAAAEQMAHSVMPRPGVEQIVIAESENGVRIVNTDYGAHLDEFGGKNTPPNAPLRRGVRAAGLRLEETPKP